MPKRSPKPTRDQRRAHLGRLAVDIAYEGISSHDVPGTNRVTIRLDGERCPVALMLRMREAEALAAWIGDFASERILRAMEYERWGTVRLPRRR